MGVGTGLEDPAAAVLSLCPLLFSVIYRLFYSQPRRTGVREACRNSKFGATRCQMLTLKCTKFDFRWCSAPDPAWGA